MAGTVAGLRGLGMIAVWSQRIKERFSRGVGVEERRLSV